jgi:uncharacterized protein (TIGR03437 family)
VTIGGQAVPAVYSIASPGFAGLYQVAVRVPQVSGNVPVVVSVNGAASNTVTMFVK